MGKNLSFCWTFFTKYLLSNNQYVVLLFEYFSLFLYLSNIFHNFFLVDNISQNIRASKMFRGPRLSNMFLSNIFPSKKVLSKIIRGSKSSIIVQILHVVSALHSLHIKQLPQYFKTKKKMFCFYATTNLSNFQNTRANLRWITST